jgi:hypothetical protein
MIWNSADHFTPTMSEPSAAEFERDREALDAMMVKMEEEAAADDDPDPALRMALTEVMRAFYVKHRKRLEAHGVDVTAFLRDLGAQAKVVKEAVKHEEKVIEADLQAQANRAEAHANMVESQYKVLKFYESRTDADWATQTPAQATEMRALIERLRESMPEMLASLPIEKRRELEGLG